MIADLRSDTLTKPGKEMLNAMMTAQVGDDVFAEDPTINELQNKMADLFGCESALFVPSGTMANQIAIKVHTQPGDEVICDKLSHVYNYEGGGIAFNSGASVRLLDGDRGRFNSKEVEAAILGEDSYLANSSLVVIENTVNKGGGSIWDIDEIKQIMKVCDNNDLKLHLDGARLFNALVETGENPKDYGQLFDSISICLSKGLGTPVGSVLIGSKYFIKKAHRIRKVFGGGMRQAGYLAAAGIYALDNNIELLKKDHERAKQIGKMLEKMEVVTKILPIETNIVIFHLNPEITSPETFLEKLAENDVLAFPFGIDSVRFVTHLDFNDEHLKHLEKVLKSIQF
jgi:threonine aldolase